jgi:type I restriction enzyme M protein
MPKASGANPGFAATLRAAADKLRNNTDAAEYKHVVLGLIFLKHISDTFEEQRAGLEGQAADPASDLYVRDPRARYAVLEDRDEYLADNVFWVPWRPVGRTCRATHARRTSALAAEQSRLRGLAKFRSQK